MKKFFLILTDLDSTFEQFSKLSEFKDFERNIECFEKKHNCNVAIHFISGTSKEDLKTRLTFFESNYPKIYQKIDYSVLEGGKKYNSKLLPIGTCSTDYAPYSKADAVKDILECYGKNIIKGACYIGEGRNDIPAFNLIKYYKKQYELGAYALSPRSRVDYDYIIHFVDFYSNQPRILGCTECIEKMDNYITSKIDSQEK